MRRTVPPWHVVAVLGLAASIVSACGTSSTRAAPSTSRAPSSTSVVAPTTTTSPPSVAPYMALWPFRTVGDVQSWQQSYQSTGSGSWHLDAGMTALDFTMDYLGFSEINAVVSTSTDSSGAHVAVGYHPTSTLSATAAVVHLVRWGTGSDAPWEVVGTDDTTFSLTRPAYGASATSPLQVGGTISGVDESIRVAVRQPSSSSAIGTFCCLPAGGVNSPWSATVTFAGATDPTLTVVASTGGHVQAVERFTVTGLRNQATG